MINNVERRRKRISGVVQGYLVYTFFVVNAQNKTGYLTIIDAGNGHVLYTSQGQPMSSFDQSPEFGRFGTFGPLVGHGFGAGFWHGPFGPWGQNAIWQHQPLSGAIQ